MRQIFQGLHLPSIQSLLFFTFSGFVQPLQPFFFGFGASFFPPRILKIPIPIFDKFECHIFDKKCKKFFFFCRRFVKDSFVAEKLRNFLFASKHVKNVSSNNFSFQRLIINFKYFVVLIFNCTPKFVQKLRRHQ